MSEDRLNVYFYACYDADSREPHCGLTAGICIDEVREAVQGNYYEPRYVTVKRVPELVGIMDADGHVSIIDRAEAPKRGQVFEPWRTRY